LDFLEKPGRGTIAVQSSWDWLVGFTAGVLLLVLSDTGSAIQDKPEIRAATFHPSGSFRLPDQAFKCEDVCSRTNFAQQLPGRGPPTSAKAGQAEKEQHHLAPLHHRDRWAIKLLSLFLVRWELPLGTRFARLIQLPWRFTGTFHLFRPVAVSGRFPALRKFDGGTKMIPGSPQIPVGLFAKAPELIAESLASKETYPDGPATGMRMLVFYISYAGRHLSASRMRGLERAKKLLAARMERMLKEERRQAA